MISQTVENFKNVVVIKVTLYNQVNTKNKEAEYLMLANQTTLKDLSQILLDFCNICPIQYGTGCEPW